MLFFGDLGKQMHFKQGGLFERKKDIETEKEMERERERQIVFVGCFKKKANTRKCKLFCIIRDMSHS